MRIDLTNLKEDGYGYSSESIKRPSYNLQDTDRMITAVRALRKAIDENRGAEYFPFLVGSLWNVLANKNGLTRQEFFKKCLDYGDNSNGERGLRVVPQTQTI